MSEDRSFVEEARREKLGQLAGLGVAPFGYGYDRTHTAEAALTAYREDASVPVRVAGRVVARRGHGKTTFLHLADQTARVQVYFRRDDLGEEDYGVVKLLDLGDVIGVSGYMFRTKTGETTVHAEDVVMLAKALRPPPIDEV